MVPQHFFQLGASVNHSTWGLVGVTLQRATPRDIYPSYATTPQPFYVPFSRTTRVSAPDPAGELTVLPRRLTGGEGYKPLPKNCSPFWAQTLGP